MTFTELRDLPVSSVAITDDGSIAVLLGRRHIALVCADDPTLPLLRRLTLPVCGSNRHAAWARASNLDLVATKNNYIELYQRCEADGLVLRESVAAHPRQISDVDFSTAQIASGSVDGSISTWDYRDLRKPCLSLSTNNMATQVKFAQESSQAHLLASGHDNGWLRIWDERNAKTPIASHIGSSRTSLCSVDWSPVGSKLVVGMAGGVLELLDLDLETAEVVVVQKSEFSRAVDVKPKAVFSSCGEHIVACGISSAIVDTFAITMLYASNLAPVEFIDSIPPPISDFALSRTIGENNTARLIALTRGHQLYSLTLSEACRQDASETVNGIDATRPPLELRTLDQDMSIGQPASSLGSPGTDTEASQHNFAMSSDAESLSPVRHPPSMSAGELGPVPIVGSVPPRSPHHTASFRRTASLQNAFERDLNAIRSLRIPNLRIDEVSTTEQTVRVSVFSTQIGSLQKSRSGSSASPIAAKPRFSLSSVSATDTSTRQKKLSADHGNHEVEPLLRLQISISSDQGSSYGSAAALQSSPDMWLQFEVLSHSDTIDTASAKNVIKSLNEMTNSGSSTSNTIDGCLHRLPNWIAQLVGGLETSGSAGSRYGHKPQSWGPQPFLALRSQAYDTPFPVSCGARFCSNNMLVVFNRTAPFLRQVTSQEQQPRSLHDLQRFLSSRSAPSGLLPYALDPGFVATLYNQSANDQVAHQSRNSLGRRSEQSVVNFKPAENMSQIFVYNCAQLSPVDFELAKEYVVCPTVKHYARLQDEQIKPHRWNSVLAAKLCLMNAETARKHNRLETAVLWQNIAMALNWKLKPSFQIENKPFGPWPIMPQCRETLKDMIAECYDRGDIQTLGTLCCILSSTLYPWQYEDRQRLLLTPARSAFGRQMSAVDENYASTISINSSKSTTFDRNRLSPLLRRLTLPVCGSNRHAAWARASNLDLVATKNNYIELYQRCEADGLVLRESVAAHPRQISDVDFSTAQIASGSVDGSISTWDYRDLRKPCLSLSTNNMATQVKFAQESSQAHLLASGHDNGWLRIWDERNAKTPIASHIGSSRTSLCSVDWSPVGSKLVVGMAGGVLELLDLDLETAEVVVVQKSEFSRAVDVKPKAVFSSCGEHIVACGISSAIVDTFAITMLYASNLAPVEFIDSIPPPISDFALSRTIGENNTARLIALTRGHQLYSLTLSEACRQDASETVNGIDATRPPLELRTLDQDMSIGQPASSLGSPGTDTEASQHNFAMSSDAESLSPVRHPPSMSAGELGPVPIVGSVPPRSPHHTASFRRTASLQNAFERDLNAIRSLRIPNLRIDEVSTTEQTVRVSVFSTQIGSLQKSRSGSSASPIAAKPRFSLSSVSATDTSTRQKKLSADHGNHEVEPLLRLQISISSDQGSSYGSAAALQSSPDMWLQFEVLSHSDTIDTASAKNVIKSLNEMTNSGSSTSNTIDGCLHRLPNWIAQLVGGLETSGSAGSRYGHKPQSWGPQPFLALRSQAYDTPFPVSCGARFCSNNMLVVFNRTAPFLRQVTSQEQQPRSLHDLQRFLSSRSAPSGLLPYALDPGFVATLYNQSANDQVAHQSRNSLGRRSEQSVVNFKPAENMSQIFVYNCAQLSPVDFELAKEYVVCPTVKHYARLQDEQIKPHRWNSVLAAKLCLMNAETARKHNRLETAVLWQNIAMALNWKLKPSFQIENKPFGPWPIMPQCRETLKDMIAECYDRGDIQTLGTLCCILSSTLYPWQYEDRQRLLLTPARSAFGRQMSAVDENYASTISINSSKSTTFDANLTPYQTVHTTSILCEDTHPSFDRVRRSSLNPDELGSPSSPSNSVYHTPPGSDSGATGTPRGRSPDLGYNQALVNDDKNIHVMENSMVVPKALMLELEKSRMQYVEMLLRWNLTTTYALMLKYALDPPTFIKPVEKLCQLCGSSTDGFRCTQKDCVLEVCCVVCEKPVRRMLYLCSACGHGGHPKHLVKWFKERKQCVLCSCECFQLSPTVFR